MVMLFHEYFNISTIATSMSRQYNEGAFLHLSSNSYKKKKNEGKIAKNQ